MPHPLEILQNGAHHGLRHVLAQAHDGSSALIEILLRVGRNLVALAHFHVGPRKQRLAAAPLGEGDLQGDYQMCIRDSPYGGAATPFGSGNFVAPATVLTVQSGMRPPYSQNWNLSIERTIAKDYLLDVRYVGNKGTHLPRFIEANPSIYGPGVNANNNNQIRQYTTCNSSGVCNYGSVGLIADDSSSTYHALEVAFSRQYAHGLSFLASYWYSKSLDYISSLNVAGSAPTLVAGENDLAQNPFDLAAEHGPSLFDATQRLSLIHI